MGAIAKNSIIVTSFSAVGTALVFVSNMVIAYKFGAGRAMDVYFAATTVPLLIITILSMTLNLTFIPVFTAYEKTNEKDRWEVVSSFINSNLILTTIICISGVIFSRSIISIITPGFNQAKIEEASLIMAILFPVIIFSAINELLAGVYYAHNRFITPSLNKILNPLLTILFVLMLGSRLNTKTLALAMLSSFSIQTAFLIMGFLRHRDFNYTLSLDFRHPEVIKIFKLMAPLIAAMVITKAIPLTDRFFLSRLQEGSISYTGYAYRLTLRMIDVMSTGLVTVLFPAMSIHAASLDYTRLYFYMMKGVKMLFFIVIPFTVIFFIYGKPAIKFLFERGQFTPHDSEATFKAFSIYLFSMPAIAGMAILSKGFYAIQKNRLVAVISVLVMAFYVVLCFFTVRVFAFLAIPFSHAVTFNLSILVFGLLIRRLLAARSSHGVAKELAKNTVSAFAAAGCMFPMMRIAGHSLMAYFLICLLGFFIYFILSRKVFHAEASDIFWEHILKYKNNPTVQ